MPSTDRSLPCGCRLDGSYLCSDHKRENLARFVAGEAFALVALSLFVATIATWSAILN